MITNEQLGGIIREKFPELLESTNILTLRTVKYSGVINTDQILVQKETLEASPHLLNIQAGKDWRAAMLSCGKQLHGRATTDGTYLVDSSQRKGISEFSVQRKENEGIFFDHRVGGSYIEYTNPPFNTPLFREGYKGITIKDVMDLHRVMDRGTGSSDSVFGDRYLVNPALFVGTYSTGHRFDGKRISTNPAEYESSPDQFINAQWVNDEMWKVAYPLFKKVSDREPVLLKINFGSLYNLGASIGATVADRVSRNVNYSLDDYQMMLANHDSHQLLLYVPRDDKGQPFSSNRYGIEITGWFPGTGLWHLGEYAAIGFKPSDNVNTPEDDIFGRIGASNFRVNMPSLYYSRLLGVEDFTRSLPYTNSLTYLQVINFTVKTLDGKTVTLGASNVEVEANIRAQRNVFGDIREFYVMFGLPSNSWHIKGNQLDYKSAESFVVDNVTVLREHVDVLVGTLFWTIDQSWYRDYYKTGFGVYSPRDSNIQANVLKTWDNFKVDTIFLAVTSSDVPFTGSVSELREAKAYAKARARACKDNDFLAQPAAKDLSWGQLSQKEVNARPRRVWMDAFNDTSFSHQYTFRFNTPVVYTAKVEGGVKLVGRSENGVLKYLNPSMVDADRGVILRDKYFNDGVTLSNVTWADIITEDSLEKEVLTDNEDLQGLTANPTANRSKQIGFGSWINPYQAVLIDRLDNEQRYRLHLKNVINFDGMGKQFVKLFDSYNSQALFKKLGISFK